MFFEGRLDENSLPLLFRTEPSQPDKDAGFRLLKVARADLCTVLLKANQKAREILTPEIFGALANLSKHKDWEQDSGSSDLFKEGRTLVADLQAAEYDLRNTVSGLYPDFPGITPLEVAKGLFNYYRIQFERTRDAIFQQKMDLLETKITAFQKIKETVDTFCKSDQVFRSYVSDGLGKRMALGCQSALLFAKEKGISLRIWNKANGENKLLIPECCSQPEINRSSPVIDFLSMPVIDLLWYEDKSQFENLSLLPVKSDSCQPAVSPSVAGKATRRAAPVERSPAMIIQNLSYRLLFSPLVAERRNAARLLGEAFADSEFLTNILLIALQDKDPVVIHFVDKMLEKLCFDRHTQDKPISILTMFVEYSIDRNKQCIVIHNTLKGHSVSLGQLHQPNPCLDVLPQSPDFHFPPLHEYEYFPHITNTIRQGGENGVTLTQGFRMGGATFNIGGTTSGAFNNPAGDVPRQKLPDSASVPPAAAQSNPAHNRAENLMNSVKRLLTGLTPDKKKALATLVAQIWPRVRDDSVSLERARESYAKLPNDIQQTFNSLYPDIHKILIMKMLP